MGTRSGTSGSSVTVKDIAHHAGVSVGTVSRVLNGFSNITPANAERVKKAIEELGYEKCRSAEMLVARRNGYRIRSGNVGVVFVGMGAGWAVHPLVAEYTRGVERACVEKGFHALVEFSVDDGKVPRCVREGKVDGLLIKTTRTLPEFVADLPVDMPLVSVGFNDPSVPIQQVAPDNRGAGWVAAEYLWKLGHRRIAFLCGDVLHPVFLSRLQGYESFLRMQKGYDPALVAVEEAPFDLQPTEKPPRCDSLLDRVLPARPTAIIAENDWMALGLCATLAERGIAVPDDVSVMGFDNDPLSAMATPPLTTYAVPFSDIAYRAALELFSQIRQPEARRHDQSIHLMRGTLVERASVRPCAPATAGR
ncbi:MAG TPA: LacI family DNA-binding transcriptional regulator [Candidatus Methylacidiphilales bacterium]